jgi:hypothetical protein
VQQRRNDKRANWMRKTLRHQHARVVAALLKETIRFAGTKRVLRS